MIKIVAFNLILFSLSFFIACKHQSDDELILATSHKFIMAIKKGNIEDVKDLIGVKLSVIGKDTESLRFDINKCKYLFNTYYHDTEMKIVVTNQIDELGERLVKVPIFNGYDSVSKLTNAVLDIYFGPPNYVPLSKISGYEVETRYDRNMLSDSIKIYK